MMAKRKVTRALAYLRVSTDEQADSGYGLDAQRAVVLAEAARRGWKVEVVADEGASGKRINGELRNALDHLSGGRAEALIVAKLDRLSRSVRDAYNILELARNQTWDLVICDLGMDLSTPAGKAMANMLATFAEFERDMISARTKEGLAAAKAKGVHIGRPRQAPADVVNRIVVLREQEQSFGAIARTLTARNVPTPQGHPVWQPSTVRRIYNSTRRA
jgi:DNA invertase Pin-like site-specific DNA recombinase